MKSLKGDKNIATFTFNDGQTLPGNVLFDKDLDTFWEFDRESTDPKFDGTMGFHIQFENEINFNSLIIQVPDKHINSFDDICLYVENVKIVCSRNTYASKGDYINFKAGKTLQAQDIRLEWSENARYATAAELINTYGKIPLMKRAPHL